MENYNYYQMLIKPFWSPPAWIFGPVWMALYVIIAITYGVILYKFISKNLSWKIALPFALNLIFNFSFTTIQFGLKNNLLASIDIILVLGTLAWAIIAIYPRYRWIAILNIPHLIWVFFATILQLNITYLNM
ncbi:MAG: tryptophan-rich sensory protein [Gammaproteobacteria bacterium]|nr:tryptophan-rich sensory protein [Gammaproteobacteria bacterium]